jgi:hypothetical protein
VLGVLKEINSALLKLGYEANRSEAFLTIVTRPKNLGYQVWKKNKEKWKVSYRNIVKLERSYGKNEPEKLYWSYTMIVQGERDGEEGRHFSADEFKKTEEIAENLRVLLVDLVGNT